MLSPVEEIKSKLDIIDIIQEYLPLKQSGANFKGLCPFHDEKTPSFMVSREKQFFKCFGCNEGGDMFTFLQKMENLEFPEALKILADKAGIELKQQNFNPQMQNLKTRLYDLHNIAVVYYQEQFFNSPLAKTAREYLINTRGLSKDIINDFKIGYAPDSWDTTSKHLRNKSFTDNEIKQSGLVVEKDKVGLDGKNYYDRFRDRIMFPITDHHGNVVGFTARTMKAEEQAKYINTPQTIIYNKSQVLYGLDKAKQSIRENKFVILVEGNMDVVASHRAGVKNAVASSGTSLTEDQIKILKRYTENIVIVFDEDNAGLLSADRAVKLLLSEDFKVKCVFLPPGIKDIDELINKNGSEVWKKIINKKVSLFEYFIERYANDKNLENLTDKIQIIRKEILPLIMASSDLIAQNYYLKILSEKTNIDEQVIRDEAAKINKKVNFSQKQTDTQSSNQQINKKEIISSRLLALAFYAKEYLDELIQKALPELLEEKYQPIYKELILYYTKNSDTELNNFYDYLKAEKSDLASVFDMLKMLTENEFTDMTRRELNREFDLSLNYLKHEQITAKLKEIENSIRFAEQQGDGARANELMKQFSELSQELARL
ncbi:DNA primase [Patescibacteria group bacterium]